MLPVPCSSFCLSNFLRIQRRRPSSSQSGLAYIEFLFVAPLLLFAGGFVIYLGSAYLARTSLTSAVGTVRFAHTRAQMSWINLVPKLQDFIDYGTIDPDVVSIFASDPTIGANHLDPSSGYYTTQIAHAVYGYDAMGDPYVPTFQQVPRANIFAMAYAYQSLKENIGHHLVFPQDPATCPAGQDCAECKPVHAGSLEASPPSLANPGPEYGDPDFDMNFAGVECQVMISSYFGPVIAGLNLIVGGGVQESLTFTKKKYFRSAV